MATIRWTSRHARLSRRFFFLSFLFFLSFSYSCYKFMDGTEFYGCILFFHSFFFFILTFRLGSIFSSFSSSGILFFLSPYIQALFGYVGIWLFFPFYLAKGAARRGIFSGGNRTGQGWSGRTTGRLDDWIGGGFFVNIGIWRRGGVSLLETSCVFSSSFLWFL